MLARASRRVTLPVARWVRRRDLSSKPEPNWYKETPGQRLAFRVTIAAGVGFLGYGGYRAWVDYMDPNAMKHHEEAVMAIPVMKGNPLVFMDLAVDGDPAGRVIFQLRKDVAPQTAENFRQLCTGEPGFGYAGTRIHAVVPGSYMQGGDITHGSGLGGRSSTGGVVPDEPRKLKHVGPGILSMISPGSPGNGTSQFYVSLARSPFADYQHVVFGNVVEGMEALHNVEDMVRARGGGMVTITRCGEIRYEHVADALPHTERQ